MQREEGESERPASEEAGRDLDVIIAGDRDASEESRRCKKMYRAQAKQISCSIL